ncbi:MAG TPA: hypothetical protein VGC89_17975 [Pyrinomonadaceae bacterium]
MFIAILFALVPGWTVKDLVIGYSTYALLGAICGLTFWLISFGIEAEDGKASSSDNGEI